MITIADIKQSGKSHVEYDRSGHAWLLGHPDGNILSFPAGDEGRIAAQMSALAHDAPDVALWIETLILAHPLESVRRRLVRAGFLIRDGHVEHLALSPLGGAYVSARVRSSDGVRVYNVWRNLTWQCDCQDWENGNAWRFGNKREHFAPVVRGLGVMCKHVWAVLIASELELAEAGAECPECSGYGFVIRRRSPSFSVREECTLCSGTGQVPEDWVEPLLAAGPEPECPNITGVLHGPRR